MVWKKRRVLAVAATVIIAVGIAVAIGLRTASEKLPTRVELRDQVLEFFAGGRQLWTGLHDVERHFGKPHFGRTDVYQTNSVLGRSGLTVHLTLWFEAEDGGVRLELKHQPDYEAWRFKYAGGGPHDAQSYARDYAAIQRDRAALDKFWNVYSDVLRRGR